MNRARRVLVSCCSAVIAVGCGGQTSEPAVSQLSPDIPVTVTGGQLEGTLAETDPAVVAFRGIP